MSIVLTRYGKMQIIDSDSVISKSLALYGEWAMDELALLSKLVTPGMRVLDVGAFIGTHTLAFSQFVGRNGKVYSFEPRKEIYDVLSKNIDLNNLENVIVKNIGLGADKKIISVEAMDLNEPKNFGGLAIFGKSLATNSDEDQVQILKIDDLEIEGIDVIKLDVEGMERDVLDGASVSISKFRPIIFSECNSLEGGREVLDYSLSRNYLVYGYLALAYNKDNFNAVQKNIFGTASELTLLLIPEENSTEILEKIADLTLVPIHALEDLVLPLLHKPQYAYEVLPTTSGYQVMGNFFPSPLASRYQEEIAALNNLNSEYEQRILQINKIISAHDDQINLANLKLSDCEIQNQFLSEKLIARTNQFVSFVSFSSFLAKEVLRLKEEIQFQVDSNDPKSALLSQLQNEISEYKSSIFWKAMTPFRAFSTGAKKLLRVAVAVRTYLRAHQGTSGMPRLLIKTLSKLKNHGYSGLKGAVILFENIAKKQEVRELEKSTVLSNSEGILFSLIGEWREQELQVVYSNIEVLKMCLRSQVGVNATIIFDHNGGGGSNTYSGQLAQRVLEQQQGLLRVYFLNSSWYVHWRHDLVDLQFSTTSIESLFSALVESKAQLLVINSVYGYPDIKQAIEKIVWLKKEMAAEIDFKVHDFYSLCPSPHLSDSEGKYCGVPENHKICQNCLKVNLSWYHEWFSVKNRPQEISEWRSYFRTLFQEADQITCFDDSSIEILARGFALEEKKIVVIPHLMTHFKSEQRFDLGGRLHIGVLGTLSPIKGSQQISDLAKYIQDQNLDITISVIGHSYSKLPDNIDVYGPYQAGELPSIIQSKGINAILMLSIIPETFSYTISEAIEMGLPIVAFDLGAQGNRVAKYSKGGVVPIGASSEQILNKIKSTLTLAVETK